MKKPCQGNDRPLGTIGEYCKELLTVLDAGFVYGVVVYSKEGTKSM